MVQWATSAETHIYGSEAQRTIERFDFKNTGDWCLHDENLQSGCCNEDTQEDRALENALTDVVLVQDLSRVDFVEDLHENESIKQQRLAGLLVVLLDVVIESSRVVPFIPYLQHLNHHSNAVFQKSRSSYSK
jgi:hypothetical protein